MSKAKIYDVTATGSTTSRDLRDRFADVVNVKDFGAKGDGVTDDTAAIQAALDAVHQRGGGFVFFDGVHIINADLIVPIAVTLRGCLMPQGTGAAFVQPAGTLKLSSAATIRLSSNSGIQNCYIVNSSLELPFTMDTAAEGLAAFSGNAITIQNASSANVANVTIHGFAFAVFGANCPQTRISDVQGDCISGIHLEDCYDCVYVSRCHFWPFTTTGTNTKELFYRSGAGYSFVRCDDAIVSDCFEYGHEIGFNIQERGNSLLTNCVSDFIGGYTTTTAIGFKILDAWNIQLNNCQTGHSAHGVWFSTPNYTGILTNSVIRDSQLTSVYAKSTICHISNNVFTDQVNGAVFDWDADDAPILHIRNNIYKNIKVGTYNTRGWLRPNVIKSSVIGDSLDFSSPTNQNVLNKQYYGSNEAARYEHYTTNDQGYVENVYCCRGSAEQPTFPVDNDTLYAVHALSWTGSTFTKAAAIRFYSYGNASETQAPAGIGFYTTARNSLDLIRRWLFTAEGLFVPNVDNAYSLGQHNLRVSQLYSATATINTSDVREKTAIVDVEDALMRAWGKVNFKAFQFTDAVEKKGEDARIHFGVIAQQVAEAFASEGLDASRYALFCYDKWDDEYETVKVVDVEAVLDEYGNEVTPAKTHTEKRLVIPAGDRYGIRYSEALALECAYQRWRLEKLEAKLNAGNTGYSVS